MITELVYSKSEIQSKACIPEQCHLNKGMDEKISQRSWYPRTILSWKDIPDRRLEIRESYIREDLIHKEKEIKK